MGKVTNFSILLNTNRKVFYPGEQIVGQIVVCLSESLETKGIKLVFEGTGYCRWTERRGSGKNRHTVKFKGQEQLFQFTSWLFSNGSNKMTHPVGTSKYPFVFTLPTTLPSSFESKIGHIRYALTAKISRSWKTDPKITRPVIINELIDTNLPQYAVGPGGEKNTQVGCCWNAGPLHFDGSIDRGCYCPGETIFIDANVDNQTPRELTALKAKLVQRIDYNASRKTKVIHSTIAKLEGPPIGRGQTATWRGQKFVIPPCPPTIHSKVIRVSYYLQLDVKVPWDSDATVRLSIIMGTIPHQISYTQQYQVPVNQTRQEPSAPGMPPPPPHILGYPSMAPPSYAAAIADAPPAYEDHVDEHNEDQDDYDHSTFSGSAYVPVYTYARPHQEH